jgi:peptide/nickel transport system permease protein
VNQRAGVGSAGEAHVRSSPSRGAPLLATLAKNVVANYAFVRLAQGFFVTFALVSLVFFIFRLLPGDPLSIYLDGSLSPRALAALRHDFGLDRPLGIQYALYLKNIARGEFGESFYYRQPAGTVIARSLGPTVVLMGSSMVVAFVLGVLLGACVAWWRGSWLEWSMLPLALTLRSVPEFWVGILVLAIFSFQLHLFPAGGLRTVGSRVAGSPYFSIDFLRHLFLPMLVSALTYMAIPMLVTRNAMLETLGEDYIEFARARGLSEPTILVRYALRNALLPAVSVFSLMAAFAVGGNVVIETIFRWPGMGRELFLAIQRKDYPVLQAVFLLLGGLVVVVNLLTDLTYALLDPRVSAE